MSDPIVEPKTIQRRSGSMLGGYQLILRVALGGMGEIWAARLKRGTVFDRVVAVKTILPELSYQANYETMFLDEARLASRIDHPNVVRVLDVGEDDDVLYQVMEWVAGASLWSLLRAAKGRALPLDIAGRILYQTCAGLHAAHELKDEQGTPLGLVHRDVSPQNILITEAGIVKVVDFGVAKYAGRGAAQTQAGELRGKVPYMSPEHIAGQPLDRRADVFALGTLFYQLVTGEHPFLKSEDLLTLSAISGPDASPRLSDVVPDISSELSDVVARAMEKSPERRTPSAHALMVAIAKEIPAAGHASTNLRVGEYVHSVLGEKKDVRTQRIEAAKRRLDEGAASGSLRPEEGGATLSELHEAGGSDEPIELPTGRPAAGKRIRWVLAASGIAILAVMLVAMTYGSGPSERSLTMPASAAAVAGARPAGPVDEPPPQSARTAESETPEPTTSPSTSATPSSLPSASSATPIPTPLQGGKAKKPPPGGEFLPDGL